MHRNATMPHELPTPSVTVSEPSSELAMILRSRADQGRRRVVTIGVAVAMVAAVLLLLGFRADSRLTYELRGGTLQNGWVEARRGEATVALSDGSSILAENGTRFSVEVIGRNAARARLAQGKLHVRVVHNDDTSYSFSAGPYEVRVVGTAFDVFWDAASQSLALTMSKGEVRLLGPDGRSRVLKAGESVRLTNDASVSEAAQKQAGGTEPPDSSRL
jgi:ferric-dicitrate binding protein FerR (iron transport regulator)